MTNKEAIEELKKVDTLDMPARLCEAYYMSIKALEQEPCEDEYIKVPKKALKYRTAGMVAYNVEWLKNHFDIERAVICGEQEPCDDLISRDMALEKMADYVASGYANSVEDFEAYSRIICQLPPVNPQEPKTGWNNHQIACMLADLFGDACACNYNGIDEWLGELCDFKDTCCPHPVGVACWEQFLKHTKSRYCECGYEMRMVEPQESEDDE